MLRKPALPWQSDYIYACGGRLFRASTRYSQRPGQRLLKFILAMLAATNMAGAISIKTVTCAGRKTQFCRACESLIAPEPAKRQ